VKAKREGKQLARNEPPLKIFWHNQRAQLSAPSSALVLAASKARPGFAPPPHQALAHQGPGQEVQTVEYPHTYERPPQVGPESGGEQMLKQQQIQQDVSKSTPRKSVFDRLGEKVIEEDTTVQPIRKVAKVSCEELASMALPTMPLCLFSAVHNLRPLHISSHL